MDLRAQIRTELEAAHKIAQKAAGEGRGFTPEETTALAAHDAKVAELRAKLAGQIAAQERVAQLSASIQENNAAAPPTQSRGTDPAAGDPAADPALEGETLLPWETEERKYRSCDALGALVSARCRFGTDQQSAIKHARKFYGERSRQSRAMQASIFTAGGATIGENFVASELIEFLRAAAAVRRAGARTLTLVGGTATLPKITGGASAYWGDEGDNITASELTTGSVKLVEKKLTALVPFSNDLFRNSSLVNDRLISDDIVRAAANAEDIAFLKGAGTSNTPKGIYYWVGAAQRANSAGTLLANVRTDIRTAKNLVENNNAPNVRRAWFMHSRSMNYMAWDLVDGNGNFAFPQLQNGDGAKLGGGVAYQDNNLSIALGGGANASEIYYAEMSECFIGDGPDVGIDVFLNAAYVDSGGSLRSGVSRDESVVRLIRKVDFVMRHVVSAAVIEAVTYGG